MSRRPRVLLGICGGIAAYKSADLVRRLIDRGFEVRCALTQSAGAFIPALTLEVLSGHAVYQQEYLTATGSGEESHVTAAGWADVLCVAPATTHTIARLALGLADDFLTTTALAFDGPLVLAPAMHSAMWHKETNRRHVAELVGRGARLVGPLEGPLASGEWGIGRLAEPVEIARAVDECLRAARDEPGRGGAATLAGRRVLVTAGPTHEPIDAVRFLGNRSSGKMGFALAAEAAGRGAEVVLVAGPVSLETPAGVERVDVESALQMRDEVYARAPAADLVVMVAAVADYRPQRRGAGKHKKSAGIPEIELVENPDILAGLPAVAPDALLVGFAAETDPSHDEAVRKLERKGADFLVVNDVSRTDVGFGADHNEVKVYRSSAASAGPDPVEISRRPKRELAAALMELFEEALHERARTASNRAG